MPADLPEIPIARRVAHRFTRHGVTVEDPYAWLRDPAFPQVKDADVLAYLNAEESRLPDSHGCLAGSALNLSHPDAA